MTTKILAKEAPGFARKPTYPLTIEEAGGRCLALLGERVLADSNRALIVRESTYPPVVYFPRTDVATILFETSSTSTYCPFKGDASYFSATINRETIEDIAWFYPTPYREVKTLKNHIAFYSTKASVTRLP